MRNHKGIQGDRQWMPKLIKVTCQRLDGWMNWQSVRPLNPTFEIALNFLKIIIFFSFSSFFWKSWISNSPVQLVVIIHLRQHLTTWKSLCMYIYIYNLVVGLIRLDCIMPFLYLYLYIYFCIKRHWKKPLKSWRRGESSGPLTPSAEKALWHRSVWCRVTPSTTCGQTVQEMNTEYSF